MTRRGRLRRRAVEGGIWVLETQDGPFVLLGRVPAELEGAEVEAEGEEVGAFGFAMSGPQLEVRTLRRC